MSRIEAVISSAPVASCATLPETVCAVPETDWACWTPVAEASTTLTVTWLRSPTSPVISPAETTTSETMVRIRPMPSSRAALSWPSSSSEVLPMVTGQVTAGHRLGRGVDRDDAVADVPGQHDAQPDGRRNISGP
jgi:hypothetical protein